MTQRQVCWKKRLLYLSPFILGCTVHIVHASEANAQQVFTTSIEKGNSNSNNNLNEKNPGQQLYQRALEQLEIIEKKFNTSSNQGSITSKSSLTDRLVHKITNLLVKATTPENSITVTTPDELAKQKQAEFKKAIHLLEQSARDYHNNDALLLLAELNFFSNYSYPRNFNTAKQYYQELANKGNATAQQMMGFLYATGIAVDKRDQAKALLYHTFAAHGGDTTAEMTMGYRYLLGIGTDEKCQDALYYYKNVATKVIDYYLSGPPGGYTPPLAKVRLSEETGGVFGYGASVTTEKRSRHAYTSPGEKSVSIDEILQYWKYLAAKQDVDAQLMLGQVYYLGTRSVSKNFEEAYNYFFQIVDKIPSNGKVPAKNSKAIGQAAGYLGWMYWRGEGVQVDPKIAYKWFSIGVDLNDASSQNALGMMYLDGIVLPKNREKAMEYFKRSADQENPNAQVNLAIEYAQTEANFPLAIRLFAKAADAKHLLAFWYLAHMNEQNIIPRPSCRVAVSYYKAIAERGDWLYPTVENAYSAYTKKDKESALLYYMLAAERGYEVAQSNVAYLLDNDKKMLATLPFMITMSNDYEKEQQEQQKAAINGLNEKELALIYWSRSANQNNVDSRVKMGDYYYKGIGTPIDYERAVSCYRVAAELQSSPLAYWNLGWMYENGIGVTKDFHLAKRAYDQALNTDQDAYLPVKLSLIKMYVKYYWEWITGHEVGPAFLTTAEEEEQDQKKKLKRKQVEQQQKEQGGYNEDIGEEMKRKYQIMKQKEREEAELNDDDVGMDDPYALNDFSEEDELLESLLILGLCMLVGYLVYVRQFRFGNNNNNNNNNNNDNGNNNAIPPQQPPF